ncbi:MAG: Major facilitator superfamily [Candidatus Moranbacteria bacterium GW2011_GWE1_49_15]|nr:MAG: Major facilitator superfamily [Candidatus Moranbacteria bacterium GW2011_GWE1_49_15]
MFHDQHHPHHFLKNKEMNELYISYAIFQFAVGIISIFEPIYLYKIGYSVTEILFYFLLVSVYFLAFSFLGTKIVSRLGVKHTMLSAVPLYIVYFLGLKFVAQAPVLFFVMPFFKAVKMQLYNYGFHLNFVEHSDRKKEGREVALIQMGALLAGGLAPFFGGMIIKFYSYPVLFGAGSVLLAVSMIPLFLTEDRHEKISFNKKDLFKGVLKKENRGALLNFSGYAVESWIGFILWPIFLYVIFKDTESVGLAASLSTVLTIALFYVVGKKTDNANKEKMLRAGSVFYFFGWAARLFAYNFTSVFFIDTYKNLSMKFIQVPWSAYFYEEAKKRNYFYFIVEREIIFHFARIIAVPFLMAIFYFNVAPYQIAFSIAALASLFYATSIRSSKLKPAVR